MMGRLRPPSHRHDYTVAGIAAGAIMLGMMATQPGDPGWLSGLWLALALVDAGLLLWIGLTDPRYPKGTD